MRGADSHAPSIFHNLLRPWLAHPLTRDVHIDEPSAVEVRYRIIKEKTFLRRIYKEWYEQLIAGLPSGQGAVLEIGGGTSFLREQLPEAFTSDVLHHPRVDVVLNGLALPVADGALRGILMVDVLHHLPEPRRFFTEAARCVRPGGVIVMIEPWVTAWSKFVYGNLHHEPFSPETKQWEFPCSGPLSAANGALPWIIFDRDRAQFTREFPAWSIHKIEVQMPFRYLLSGGVSMKSLTPGWTFGFWETLERALQPWMHNLGMFAFISLQRL
jgi:SAM-dependent methyltransferase